MQSSTVLSRNFSEKDIKTNSERKANQNEKLKIIFYSQRIKKEKEPLISQQTLKPKRNESINKNLP